MVIKLLSAQIPAFWENIKFACKQADEVEEKDYQAYFNELLQMLLNEKAQCWVRLNEKRELQAMLITRVLLDKITDKKCLFLQCLYSFNVVDKEVWHREFLLIKAFADTEKCTRITFDSKNPKIWELAQSVGFKEHHRNFIFEGGA